jgi:hypothetical protein
VTVIRIGGLVEGEGDVRAVPRLARDIGIEVAVVVDPVIPAPVSRLRKAHSLEEEIDNIARKMGSGGILVLLDCDWKDGCPKYDGPSLLRRAQAARRDVPIRLVLAEKEYEAWFLAAAESLCGLCGLPGDLTAPPEPEAVRGAKEWLSHHMPRHTPYSPVPDQATLTTAFDMALARRRSPSFDKCYREIAALLQTLSVRDG